jgi:glycosyltransferase involved in cell wall biosynthesis
MTLQNFRPLCAEAKLFRDGRTCTDCVGRSPWRAVRYACYRGSVPASIVAAATIALHRRLATWDLVDRVLAPSESVKAVFVDGGFDPGRIVVRPNFVPDPGGRARSPSASRTVLYVGRLSPEKGLRVLLDAWRAASAELGDLELVIVGDGPQRAELERLAPASVSFAGYVEPGRLPEYMLAARALVFPTLWSENFGRSIIEAMAAGIPVLASDIGTPSELVGELGERWLVPPRRVPAWAVALAGLTDDDAVRAGGSRARELFEHRYAPAAGLRSLLATYAELVPE